MDPRKWNESERRAEPQGPLPAYVAVEVTVAVVALVGNLLVVVAFSRNRKLRKLTNYYIVSLALADLLVALVGIPTAIMSYIGLPRDFEACLFTISLLIMLCTVSILNLVAVSVDRYWAILFPLQYASCMTGRIAFGLIVCCWILGTIIGFLPLMGWHGKWTNQCLFTHVMDYSFLVFLYFATIISPSILMGIFYARIYCVVIKQLRQISALSCRRRRASNGRVVIATANGAISRKEVNAAKILFIIVLFFVLCWIPLYTINTVQAFCHSCYVPQWLLDATIVLSHVNSAVNPLLYAYHLRDFRDTFRTLLHRGCPASSGEEMAITSITLDVHRVNQATDKTRLSVACLRHPPPPYVTERRRHSADLPTSLVTRL